MQGSTPQTYTIAEFLKWNDDKELVLNPKFQRGSVWSPQARTYLIDSILRGYPIPKLLMRTSVDRDSRRTVRDVVDGQQRMRSIIDFSSGKLTLGAKAKELKGARYADLTDEYKDRFLAYKLTCEHLLNASDEDVLEVFLRINSYAIPVSEAELRNARFEGDFSDLVKEAVQQLGPVWRLGVISERDRVRMVDQSVVAEGFAFLDRGVADGSESDITHYYESVNTKSRAELPDQEAFVGIALQTASLMEEMAGEPLVQRPHFLMMLAATAYAHDALPQGKLDFSKAPKPGDLLADGQAAQDSLLVLNSALASDQPGGKFEAFREARTSTQRMRSRQVRFEHFCRALAGHYAE